MACRCNWPPRRVWTRSMSPSTCWWKWCRAAGSLAPTRDGPLCSAQVRARAAAVSPESRVSHALFRFCWSQWPVPAIGEDELLVRVHGCGLCGSDILKIAQEAVPPVILGHELTGTIVECGKTVSKFEVGQRVIVAHHVPCGSCHYCRQANYSMCAAFKASNIDPCGFAEYIRVPAAHARRSTLEL